MILSIATNLSRDYIAPPLKTIYEGIKAIPGYLEEMNITVHDWTKDNIPPHVAKIAEAFINALPILILHYTVAPSYLVAGLYYLAGKYVVQAFFQDAELPATLPTVVNAYGFSAAAFALAHIGEAMITRTASPIVPAALGALIAACAFELSGLAYEVHNAT